MRILVRSDPPGLAACAGELLEHIRHHAPELVEQLDARLLYDCLEPFVSETRSRKERLERVDLRLKISPPLSAEQTTLVSSAVHE